VDGVGVGHADPAINPFLNARLPVLRSLLGDRIPVLGAEEVSGRGFAFPLDPLMGVVGSVLIGRWAWGLARQSALSLLDAEDHGETAEKIRAAIESEEDVQVADLHLWRVGAASRACILSIVTHEPKPVEHYRRLLETVPGIDHLTVEVRQCLDERCFAGDGTLPHT